MTKAQTSRARPETFLVDVVMYLDLLAGELVSSARSALCNGEYDTVKSYLDIASACVAVCEAIQVHSNAEGAEALRTLETLNAEHPLPLPKDDCVSGIAHVETGAWGTIPLVEASEIVERLSRCSDYIWTANPVLADGSVVSISVTSILRIQPTALEWRLRRLLPNSYSITTGWGRMIQDSHYNQYAWAELHKRLDS